MNILVIDDDSNARKTLSKILKAKGFDVEEAGTGAEAVVLCRVKFFNLVLIDVRLPDMSGLEVLRAVYGINADTVAIMMTGYASLDSSIEAMNKGAYSYFTKPLNMDAVLIVAEKALEKQRLSIENRELLMKLKLANEKLKEFDQLKSHFVGMVSHELRNPLSVLGESLSLILDKVAGSISEEQKEILEIGKRSVDRLIRLVSDLLNLEKIEAGKMELKREEIDVAPFLNELLIPYLSRISKSKLTLETSIPMDLGLLWTDRDKLTEVIINLLSNAMKYTPVGGRLALKVEGNKEELRFEIADTGPGIPAKQREKIFDKFTRITAEKQEGTGLGLPIVKEIVELHKGKIWVESDPGQGSRFIFTIPRDFRT